MINALTGIITAVGDEELFIQVAGSGVEYACKASDRMCKAAQDWPVQQYKLLIHHHFTADNQVLYAFASGSERSLFRLLISKVSQIGPSKALGVLSSFTPDEFLSLVAANDSAAIAKAKGLGKKTAERIILELRDKVGITSDTQPMAPQQKTSVPTFVTAEQRTDAQLALATLGFKMKEAKEVVQKAESKLTAVVSTDVFVRLCFAAK